MPNTGYVVICPFYITHAEGKVQHTITCECIKNNMGFSMLNQLRFLDIEEQAGWLELFCSTHMYMDCPYCQSIYQKYEKENGKINSHEQILEQIEKEECNKLKSNEISNQLTIFDFLE